MAVEFRLCQGYALHGSHPGEHRTGLVGGWHGTLALALVKDVVLGKGFQGIFLVEVG